MRIPEDIDWVMELLAESKQTGRPIETKTASGWHVTVRPMFHLGHEFFRVQPLGAIAATTALTMSAIDWQEEFDDDDNSVWYGASPYTTDSDPESAPNVYWRLKQRLHDNQIEWYAAHDSELGGETGDNWTSLEEAKAACQAANDEIVAAATHEL